LIRIHQRFERGAFDPAKIGFSFGGENFRDIAVFPLDHQTIRVCEATTKLPGQESSNGRLPACHESDKDQVFAEFAVAHREQSSGKSIDAANVPGFGAFFVSEKFVFDLIPFR
jgi:hypothetical protein